MRTHRHSPTIGPFSVRSKGSEKKLTRDVGGRLTDPQGSYERYMALARAAGFTGDATEMENCYQHAEHYFRLMSEQANSKIRKLGAQ
ncbi:DUF4167 domain-containing protein [Methylocystis heyeri]|uniref:DUF4167 domain-containing protein n=1 Tax=Methylocystis heyeri TaxID=391905 RepID=A0A6B8KKG4_9HYPH|nr:DUF4167 domain-containing protein [Methylocystis heyeri]